MADVGVIGHALLSLQCVRRAVSEYKTGHAFSFKSVILLTRDTSRCGFGKCLADLVKTLDQRLRKEAG